MVFFDLGGKEEEARLIARTIDLSLDMRKASEWQKMIDSLRRLLGALMEQEG